MENTVNANIQITLYGKPIELNLPLPAEPVKPMRILPVLQTITNTFVDTAVEVFVSKDEQISCKVGCDACCYQPVPLAEPEVYQIAKLVEDMPESRQAEIKKKFADTCEKLEKIDWFNRMENIFIESTSSRKEEIRKLALEYLAEKIACPFLENKSCSIHQYRPLSCREFLVTSPAENCQNPTSENIKHVDLKFKVSDIVRGLWKSENLPNTSFVTMIYALEWAKKHPENFAEKSGGDWLGEFFGSLK
ncbi:MAG: YkgJ family cysteine cluster protein [Acidobacteriota bacterium]